MADYGITWIIQFIWLYIAATMVGSQEIAAPPKYCGGTPADLIFVMDSSGSIGYTDFQYQKEFVRGMVDLFDIDSGKIQVGIVSYSNWAFPEFQLNTYAKKNYILRAIDKVTHFRGDTNTGATLEYLREVMFQRHNGARPEVPHIAIVLTDGRSNDPWYTMQQARLARAAGITLFSIGVGNDLFEYELMSMASEPTSKYLFRVGDFLALQYIKEILAIEACKVPPPVIRVSVGDASTTTATTTTTPEPTTTSAVLTTTTTHPSTTTTTTTTTTQKPRLCADADSIDLVFSAAPASSPDESAKTLTFFREVSSRLPIGEDKIRVGLVPDNCRGIPEFKIKSSGDTDDALRTLDKYIKRETRTTFAHQLKYMRKVSFQPDQGARTSTTDNTVKRRAVVVVNGQDDLDRAQKEAFRLKKYEQAEIFAIGIGNYTEFQNSVMDIVSRPSLDHVLFLSNYNELPKGVGKVQMFICPDV